MNFVYWNEYIFNNGNFILGCYAKSKTDNSEVDKIFISINLMLNAIITGF